MISAGEDSAGRYDDVLPERLAVEAIPSTPADRCRNSYSRLGAHRHWYPTSLLFFLGFSTTAVIPPRDRKTRDELHSIEAAASKEMDRIHGGKRDWPAAKLTIMSDCSKSDSRIALQEVQIKMKEETCIWRIPPMLRSYNQPG